MDEVPAWVWWHLGASVATGVYGVALFVRYGGSHNEASWLLNIFGAIACGVWPLALPALAWAHVRYRREAPS